MDERLKALGVFAAVTLALGVNTGCATRQDTQHEIRKLKASVERAKGAGGLKRSPQELAMASASLKQAQAEFDEWDNDVDDVLETARASVKAGWARLAEPRPEIMLQGIYFINDSSEIGEDQKPTLDEAIAVLAWEDDATVVIAGHASSPGDAHWNYHLTESRAEAVAQYFIDHGIDPGRIGIAPHDEFRPIASNRTRRGRAENRRVDFKVLRTYPLGYMDTPSQIDAPADYPFPSHPKLDASKNDAYADTAGKKFARGTYNLACGWIEVPKTYSQSVAKQDLLTGSVYGIAHGAAKGASRTAAGVFEMGTFFIPLPKDFSTLDPDILDLRHIF